MKQWCNDTKSHWISLCISSCPIHKRVGIALTITRIGSYLLKSVHINACLSSELITYTGHNCSHTSSLHCGMAFKPFVKGRHLWIHTNKQFPSKAVRSKGKQSCETTEEVTWISPIIYRHLKGNETPAAWIILFPSRSWNLSSTTGTDETVS